MRVVWLALVVALGLAGEAQAQSDPCRTQHPHGVPKCWHGFVADATPTTFRAIPPDAPIDYLVTTWRVPIPDDEFWVIAGGQHGGCRAYARFRGLRITENYCDDGLVVKVRSTVEPMRVRFGWEWTR